MRKFIVIAVGLALVATAAEARHRHHRGHSVEPLRTELGSVGRGGPESYSRARSRIADLIPRDWRQEPPDPDRPGNRFTSPSADAWLAFYAMPVDQEPVGQHWKAVAFADGEDLNFLQREHNWVAVSGFKGERMFYRKAVLACGGRQWRHIAFEYPAEAKREFDPLTARMARALDGAVNENCDTTVGGQ